MDNENLNNKQFDDQVYEHLPEDIKRSKTSLEMAAIGFLGALGCLFVYFFLNRIIYVMVILPIFPVVGIITAIKTIISDKGIPKAYIGLILSILGILPSILCTIVFFLDIYFGLFVK